MHDVLTSALFALVVFMLIPALIGLAVLVETLLKPKKAPMDSSNRFNHLRLVFFALTRPQKFVGLIDKKSGKEAFPWLRGDEWENMK